MGLGGVKELGVVVGLWVVVGLGEVVGVVVLTKSLIKKKVNQWILVLGSGFNFMMYMKKFKMNLEIHVHTILDVWNIFYQLF